jgi:putative endonuclease
MHYVYVLRSVEADKFYVGITSNVKRRLETHNAGFSPFTNKYKPWKLLYFEAYTSESLARKRELKLKNHGKGFQELKKRIFDEKGEG